MSSTEENVCGSASGVAGNQGSHLPTPVLLDVIEVEIAAPHRVRVMATNKTPANAEAFINIAVWRRGTDTHFYTTCAPDAHRDGDTWKTGA